MKPTTTNQTNGRGWVLDQLILIGHYEAQLSHLDEKLNDLWETLNNETEDMERMQQLTNTINSLYEVGRGIYESRKDAEEQIFKAFPEADKTWWCFVKHAAAAFVIASENFHARGFDADSERAMLGAAENLGRTTGLALGFEPYGCLRCLDEAIKGGKDAKAETTTF